MECQRQLMHFDQQQNQLIGDMFLLLKHQEQHQLPHTTISTDTISTDAIPTDSTDTIPTDSTDAIPTDTTDTIPTADL